eukprot:365124-Prorocentrum_lima.AAC.1
MLRARMMVCRDSLSKFFTCSSADQPPLVSLLCKTSTSFCCRLDRRAYTRCLKTLPSTPPAILRA